MYTKEGQVAVEELYSVKQSDDLYLNMVKLTDLNRDKWLAFAHAQDARAREISKNDTLRENLKKHIQIIDNIGGGITGFCRSFRYYNNKDTEVWIAFASYEKVEDPNEVDFDKVEMCTTVTTSANAPFTAHMGVFRSVSALEKGMTVHRDLANYLHVAATRFMLSRYPYKTHMLNVSLVAMREILMSAFAKEGISNAVYILEDACWQSLNKIKVCLEKYAESNLSAETLTEIDDLKGDNIYKFIFENNLYEPIKAALIAEKKEAKKYYDDGVAQGYIAKGVDRVDAVEKYSICCIAISLLDQQYAIHNQYYTPPITVKPCEGKKRATNEKFVFTLNDGENELFRLDTSKDDSGEYAWFFKHADQFQARSPKTPLIAVNLQQLALLKEIGPEIKHITRERTEAEQEAIAQKIAAKEKEQQERAEQEAKKAEQERAKQQEEALEKERQERLEKERVESERAKREWVEEKTRLEQEKKKHPELEEAAFGQDRILKIVSDQYLRAKLIDYLYDIERNPKLMGKKLSRYLIRIKKDVKDLTPTDLHQYILRTKEPVIFAEQHVKGDGSDWNVTELEILGDTSFITEVKAYDNGASGTDNSALKLKQYKEHLPTQFLISVSGPIFKRGTADYKEVVDSDGNIDYAKYYKKIEELLLSTLLAQNEICSEQDLHGIVTLPGIGCGEFADEFRGIMGIYLNAAIKDLLKNHHKSLGAIKGIMFDPFAECKGEICDFGDIKYVVAPSGMGEGGNTDHHLMVDGKKMYLSQLADSEERASFFKAIGLDIEPEEVLCISFDAADKCSQQGNDAIAGYRTTDEGRKASATDVMGVHSRVEGYYDTTNEKSPRYRSHTPGDQGYGYAYIKNRDIVLPLNAETQYQAECPYRDDPELNYDPQISSAFYVKLGQLYKDSGTPQSALVNIVIDNKDIVKQTEVIDSLLITKTSKLKDLRLHEGLLRGEKGDEETYIKLSHLFIDQNPNTVKVAAAELNNNNKTVYSSIVSSTRASYPEKYKELLQTLRKKTNLAEELAYDVAKAFTHDILANYTTSFQHVNSAKFVNYCFGRELPEDLANSTVSNSHIIVSVLKDLEPNAQSRILLFFVDYCKSAALSSSAGALQIRQIMQEKGYADIDGIKSAIDKLDGDFMVLDVYADDASYTIKMIAPDEARPGQSKYVEMKFTPDKAAPEYSVEIREFACDEKEEAHAYIASQILAIKHPDIAQAVVKPVVKSEHNTSDLIEAIYNNYASNNTLMPTRGLDVAKNNFKHRALRKLLDLYTEQHTSGQIKAYSELVSGTPLHNRIKNEAEAKVEEWLAKPKAYWSLCYATAIQGFKKEDPVALVESNRRNVYSRGRGEPIIEAAPVKKIQQQIKEEMLSVSDYRKILGVQSLVADSSSNEYLERINKHSANNYASWLKAMGIKDISATTEDSKEVVKLKLQFKNGKSVRAFHKELGVLLGIEYVLEDNSVLLDPDQLDLIRNLYTRTHKSDNIHHKMYIAPALRIMNAVIKPLSVDKAQEEVPQVVFNERFSSSKASKKILALQAGLTDIKNQLTWNNINLALAIDRLKNPEKHSNVFIKFSDCVKAMDLCLTSYIALNYELLPAEWIHELGELHAILSKSYDLNIKIDTPSINSLSKLRGILNKRLNKLNLPALTASTNEDEDMASMLNLIIAYCEALHLPTTKLMHTDMLFAFQQYADLSKLNTAINSTNRKITDTAFKTAVDKLVAQPDDQPEIKDENATTLRVQQYEKPSYRYMHVDEKGDLTIMLPFTGGSNISTDNTCKARLAIDRFCESIKSVIAAYITDLEKDISIISAHDSSEEGLAALAAKNSRLAILKDWRQKFNTYPNLLNTNALFKSVQDKLKDSNTIAVAHAVRVPDGIRGFKCEHSVYNPLTETTMQKSYDAQFARSVGDESNEGSLLRRLMTTTPHYERCDAEAIRNAAIARYKERYADAENIPADALEKFEYFRECIEIAVREKIDKKFQLEMALNEDNLEFYRDDIWFLEEGDACEFEGAFNALLVPDKWEGLELQVKDASFYTNRDANTFMVMAEIFVTSLTSLYYPVAEQKVDFAEFIQQPANLEKFYAIVQKCFRDGKSFIDPILTELINPALRAKSLTEIHGVLTEEQVKEIQRRMRDGQRGMQRRGAEEHFQGNFTTVDGAPHYDEFLELPDEPVNARVNFYSFGGSISCSINELDLLPQIPYKQLAYTSDSVEISTRNNIGNYGFALNIADYVNPSKTAHEIAQFLTLKIPSEGDKEQRVYDALPKKIIEQIRTRADFTAIRQQLVKTLGQGSYAKLAKSWGMTSCLYITPEIELKLYMLYATKCENEWMSLHPQDEGKTLAALAGKSPENRVLHMLHKLDIAVVGSELLRNDNDSAYILECEEDKAIGLLRQFVGLNNTLYLRTELAESCYKTVQEGLYPINIYNNLGSPNDSSKIIVTLRILFPNLTIKPDIKPYNESYDPNIVLVNFCEDRGHVLKCHNQETLRSVYETVNIYHAEACKIDVSADAMLLFIRQQLGAGSEVTVDNAKEAFKRANIYYIGDISIKDDGCFRVGLDKASQKLFFSTVLNFFGDCQGLCDNGIMTQQMRSALATTEFLSDTTADNEVAFAGSYLDRNARLNGHIIMGVSTRYSKANAMLIKFRDAPTNLLSQNDFIELNKSLLKLEEIISQIEAQVAIAPNMFSGLQTYKEQLQTICTSVRSKENEIKLAPDYNKFLSKCGQYAVYGGLVGVGISSVLWFSGKLPFAPLSSTALYNITYLKKPACLAIISTTALLGIIGAAATIEGTVEPKFTSEVSSV